MKKLLPLILALLLPISALAHPAMPDNLLEVTCVKYVDWFTAAQKEAREDLKGIWGPSSD